MSTEKKRVQERIDYSDKNQMKNFDDEKKKFAKSDTRMKNGKPWKDFTSDVNAAKNKNRGYEVVRKPPFNVHRNTTYY